MYVKQEQNYSSLIIIAFIHWKFIEIISKMTKNKYYLPFSTGEVEVKGGANNFVKPR